MSSPRRILVTGTSRGIGQFLAGHFLERGDVVVGCSRQEATIEHSRYHHMQADITIEKDVKGLFSFIREQLGCLDVLINNAGIAAMNAVALMPISSAKRIIETNFLGPFLCSQFAVRLLRKSPAPRIVNITSVAVPLRLEGEAAYAASKSAIEIFTRILAKEVAPFAITCNAVGPGPVKTDLTRGLPEKKIKALLERQAIKKMVEPEDVANVIDFFLSPASKMVTGQVIYLGGVG